MSTDCLSLLQDDRCHFRDKIKKQNRASVVVIKNCTVAVLELSYAYGRCRPRQSGVEIVRSWMLFWLLPRIRVPPHVARPCDRSQVYVPVCVCRISSRCSLTQSRTVYVDLPYQRLGCAHPGTQSVGVWAQQVTATYNDLVYTVVDCTLQCHDL